MKTIHKFNVLVWETTRILTSDLFVPVHVGMQNGVITVWAEVRPGQATKNQWLTVFGTGHAIPDDQLYIGTVMDGQYVWHVYQRAEAAERAGGWEGDD